MTGAAPTPPLPHRSIHGYGAGIVAYMLGLNLIELLVTPVVLINLGFNPLYWGLLRSAVGLWDAFTDPIVGHLSNQTRSRWGRRRPFIFVGAILVGVATPLLGLIPAETMDENAFFLAAGLAFMAFNVAFTVYSVPYLSLGYEISADSGQRFRLQFFRSFYALVPALVGGWYYRIAQAGIFDDVFTGYRWVLLGLGAVIASAGVLPAIFCREPYYQSLPTTPPRENLLLALAEAFRNRPFLLLMGIIFTMLAGVNAANGVGMFAIIYYVFQGDTVAGATLTGQIGTISTIASFAFIFLVREVVKRRGRKSGLALCLACGLVGNLSQWFLVTPDNPALSLVSFVLIAPSLSAFWIVANAMKADVCDWDELHHGKRREGIFAAASNWVQKGASAIASALIGAGLAAIGFDAALGGGQSAETILRMRLLLSLVPAALLLGCLGLLLFYPLDETRIAAINRELEGRRGVVR